MEDLMKVDIYELLNISFTADEKEIKKAYRKKALSCHPDKNPDNPQAAQLFQQLTKALEILTDGAARAAYNQVLKNKKAAAARNQNLDSKRKKLKEDLEAREKAAQDNKINHIDAAKQLEQEIERLRKDGSKQVEEEKELLRRQIIQEGEKPDHLTDDVKIEGTSMPRLKVKWKAEKGDPNNGGYTQEDLRNIFGKHGQVTCVVISGKKRGSAIVEFSTKEFAQQAFEFEVGRHENPFTLSWISGQPPTTQQNQDQNPLPTWKGPPPVPEKDSALTSRDYESLVLMKLRQAEERKKLIQQMLEDEN